MTLLLRNLKLQWNALALTFNQNYLINSFPLIIGTGSTGGGWQTWLVMGFDLRIGPLADYVKFLWSYKNRARQ